MLLAAYFRGLDNRHEPHLLEPGVAQDLSNVTLDSGAITGRNAPGAALAGTGLPAVAGSLSLHKFGARYIASTADYQYAEYGGRIYRAAPGQTPQKSLDGATWYSLGMDAPTAPTGVGFGGAGLLTFFSSYNYYVTYTNAFGGESAPSPALPVTTNGIVNTYNLTIPVSADAQVTGKIYRSGGNQGARGLVATVADNVTVLVTEGLADTAIGANLTTDGVQTPNALANAYSAGSFFEGIAVTPDGVLLGWSGSRLWASKALTAAFGGGADFWGNGVTDPSLALLADSYDFPEAIRAALPYAGQVLVVTIAGAHVLAGTSARNFQRQRTRCEDGCVARDTVVPMASQGVFWLGPKGVVRYAGGESEIVSRASLSEGFMATIIASVGTHAVKDGERYRLYHPNTATPGWLELDPRISPPWLKGTGAYQAAHYNKTDQKLYVYTTGATPVVAEWEAGAPLAWTFKTGDFMTGDIDSIAHWGPNLYGHFSGTVAMKPYSEGIQKGDAAGYSHANATMTRWATKIPPCSGGRFAVELVGAAGVGGSKVIGLSVDMPKKTGSPMSDETQGLEAQLGATYNAATLQGILREILRRLGDMETRSPVAVSGVGGINATADTAAGAATRSLAITFTDMAGKPAAGRHVRVWLSDTGGGGVSGTVPSGGTTVTKGTSLQVLTAGLSFEVQLDATGTVELSITHNAARSYWLVASQPGEKPIPGPSVRFT